MKIVPRELSAAPSAPAREVAPTRTPASREQIRAAIGRALERETGTKASPKLVDTLTAQACLETASGERMYNYNFGGIKGRGPSGATAVLRTKEVEGGREVSVKDGFRAYASLDEGATDYVRLVRAKFGGSLDAASKGDLQGFAHALKQAGYYTASETDYAKGLASLAGASSPARPSTVARTSRPLSSLSTDLLARVNDTLDQDRAGIASLGPLAPPSRTHAHRAAADDEDDG